MKDELVKAVACNQKIRVIAATTTDLAETARKQHDLWPTSAAALGRVLGMAAIMGCMEKEAQHKVTIQINGHGPIGTIMAEGWGNGNVRGFVGDPHQFLQYNQSKKLAVGLSVGSQGYLKVTRSLGMKDSFTSQVALISGEIGEDFAAYYTISEQTPSAVSVGVLVNPDNSVQAAGALLIQVLPDAGEEQIAMAEAAIAHLRPISSMVNEGMTAEAIVKSLFSDAEILGKQSIQWHCDCSKERFYGALTTLKRSDLEEMLEEDHGCEVKCEFCNRAYLFSEDDLKTILEFKAACGK